MKVIVEGHRYVLDNFENITDGQTLQFIHKEVAEDGSLSTVQDGTTNEEVIKVLMNRIQYLNTKMQSPHNDTALEGLGKALAALEARTKARQRAGIEGTALSEPAPEVLAEPTTADEFNNPENNDNGEGGEHKQGAGVDSDENNQATGALQNDGGAEGSDPEASQAGSAGADAEG